MPFIEYQEMNFTPARQAKIETANAIIEEYHRQGYTLTLRQLYYQFVARGLIENSERSYKNIGNIVADGRIAGLIDWNAIEDRGRGIRPWLIEEDEKNVLNGIEYGLSLDLWEPQGTYVEVWVEKEALASVIERPARRFRVPFMPCKGYLSASEAWRAGQRFEEMENAGRDCYIIHLGDHDPSGIDMSRDNRERVQMFGGANVQLRRIALNMDQVEQYSPPPNPAKVTDSRAEDYIRRFGRTSWELDALEPRVLDKLISDEIEKLIPDPDAWEASKSEEKERRAILSQLHGRFDEIKSAIEEGRL